jgi:hypothetical protein
MQNSAKQVTVYGGAECLDVANESAANSSAVDIWPCNGGTNQQWTVNPNGTITGVGSGKCLDVNEADTANGSLMDIYTCNGQSNQQWTVG